MKVIEPLLICKTIPRISLSSALSAQTPFGIGCGPYDAVEIHKVLMDAHYTDADNVSIICQMGLSWFDLLRNVALTVEDTDGFALREDLMSYARDTRLGGSAARAEERRLTFSRLYEFSDCKLITPRSPSFVVNLVSISAGSASFQCTIWYRVVRKTREQILQLLKMKPERRDSNVPADSP